MIISLNEAKEFLRIESDYIVEDNFITSLIAAAETYIKNATGKTFNNTNELAKLATKILLSHWYENRQIDANTSLSRISFSLDCILTQLTYCEDGVTT